jgi:hypothetical protein
MTGMFTCAVGGRRRQGVGFTVRVGRRAVADSLYLISGPATAAAGLLVLFGGLRAGAVS